MTAKCLRYWRTNALKFTVRSSIDGEQCANRWVVLQFHKILWNSFVSLIVSNWVVIVAAVVVSRIEFEWHARHIATAVWNHGSTIWQQLNLNVNYFILGRCCFFLFSSVALRRSSNAAFWRRFQATETNWILHGINYSLLRNFKTFSDEVNSNLQ